MTEPSSLELPLPGDPSGSGSTGPDTDRATRGDPADDDVDVHFQETRDLAEMLEHHFRGDPLVRVGSDVAIYYEEGNPAASIVPDLFVLREDQENPLPGHFKLWESGASPSMVIEVSASATREADLGLKRDVCELFGVEEYFLYDPLGEYLDPPFRGYRLAGRAYRILTPEPDGSIVSGLGLSFRVDDGRLTVVDTASGKPLMHTVEALDELERLRGDVVRMLGE